MIRSCRRASARSYARRSSISHGIEEGSVVEARRWFQEANQLRDGTALEALHPRQRAALRQCAAAADHRAVWCLEVVG